MYIVNIVYSVWAWLLDIPIQLFKRFKLVLSDKCTPLIGGLYMCLPFAFVHVSCEDTVVLRSLFTLLKAAVLSEVC